MSRGQSQCFNATNNIMLLLSVPRYYLQCRAIIHCVMMLFSMPRCDWQCLSLTMQRCQELCMKSICHDVIRDIIFTMLCCHSQRHAVLTLPRCHSLSCAVRTRHAVLTHLRCHAPCHDIAHNVPILLSLYRIHHLTISCHPYFCMILRSRWKIKENWYSVWLYQHFAASASLDPWRPRINES